MASDMETVTVSRNIVTKHYYEVKCWTRLMTSLVFAFISFTPAEKYSYMTLVRFSWFHDELKDQNLITYTALLSVCMAKWIRSRTA